MMPHRNSHRVDFPTAFERLTKLHQRIWVLASLIALLSTLMLSRPLYSGKPNFHPTLGPALHSMSLVTAVLSGMISLMLEFYCDSLLTPTEVERVIMWAPVILLDVAIVEFIAGVSSSSLTSASPTSQGIFGWYVKGLIFVCICLTVYLSNQWGWRAKLRGYD